MKAYYLLLPLTILTFIGCKKETATPTPVAETIIVSPEKIVEINTSFGSIYLWLYKETPLHYDNFLKLAADTFYKNTLFHRCVSNFVIQGGDPLSKDNNINNDGTGGPGYTIPAEIDSTKFKHDYGALAAAREDNATNPLMASNGSQFYIVTETGGAHFLDGQYTVFGKVIKGMDVANTINSQPKNKNDRPNINITMTTKVLEKTLAELKSEFNFIP